MVTGYMKPAVACIRLMRRTVESLTLDGQGERLDILEREKNPSKMASVSISGTAT